jgi:hypothetical protein
VFHKKNSVQLECVSKAYIKDLMYLKRNTKFLLDQWGLSPASQSSLNEIGFTSQSGFFKTCKVGYAFFHVKVSCQYGFVIDNKKESDLFK